MRKTSFRKTDEAGGGRRCSRLAQARPENNELSFNVFKMQLFPLTHKPDEPTCKHDPRGISKDCKESWTNNRTSKASL